MRIAIISINYRPERTGIGVYTTGLAESLASLGHAVTVHTAFPYYPDWSKLTSDKGCVYRRELLSGVDVRRTFLYVPRQPNALMRILHELSFVCSAGVSYVLTRRKDLTIIVLPPLALGVTIGLLARLKRSRIIVHVQDLQPDAAVELGMLKQGLLTRALYWIEGLSYRLADRVSTISEGMRRKIISKDVAPGRTMLLRNWANDDIVRPADRCTSLRAEWGLSVEDFVVLYSGNLGRKQGLSSLIEAAHRLKSTPSVKILIVGNGVEQAELIAEARERSVDNVLFKPLQPLERLSELLATADVSVIPQRRAVTDIVLPSKLCNIMASGRPVVAAAPPGSDLSLILTESKCGILVEPESGEGIAAAIIDLMSNKDLRLQMGENGRSYVESHLTQAALIHSFATQIVAVATRR